MLPVFLKNQSFTLPDVHEPQNNIANHGDIRLRYSAANHVSVRQFVSGPSFSNFLTQFVTSIESIANFAKNPVGRLSVPLSPQENSAIDNGLKNFKARLIAKNPPGFAESDLPNIYGPVKEMFDELELRLSDDRIALHIRLTAIKNLVPALGLCAGGIFTELQDQIIHLQGNIKGQGINGAAYLVKKRFIESVILNFVKNRHPNYRSGEEVHFVNAYFNYLAADLDMPVRQDNYTRLAENSITSTSLTQCRHAVLTKLRPGSIARVMADTYMDQIRGAVSAVGFNADQPIETGDYNRVTEAITNMQSTELNAQYGNKIEFADVLDMNDVDYSAKLQKNPLKVAVKLMATMREHNVVNHNNTVTLFEDNVKGRIKQLDNMFWIEKEGRCDELTITDLCSVLPIGLYDRLENQGHGYPDIVNLLATIVMHADEHYPNEQMESLPASWVDDFADLLGSRLKGRCEVSWVAPLLHSAARSGQLAAVQTMIDYGVPTNHVDKDNRSPLEIALSQNRMDVAYLLESGRTTLMRLARNGSETELRAKLDAGVSKDAVDKNGFSALMHACDTQNTVALRVLLSCGADTEIREKRLSSTVLMLAAVSGRLTELDALLEGGANRNAQDSSGFTPIMLACKNGDIDAVTALLSSQTDLELKTNEFGQTVLMIAAVSGNISAIQALIEGGANKDAIDKNGITALMKACLTENLAAVETLIRYGVDKELKENRRGATALNFTANIGNISVLYALLAGGADTDARNLKGFTSLMIACGNRHESCVEALISYGADMESKNGITGCTALMLAAQSSHGLIISLLLRKGAVMNALNWKRETALVYAVESGKFDNAQILLDAGADAEIKDINGRTVIDRLLESDKPDEQILKCLLQAGANGKNALFSTVTRGNIVGLRMLSSAGINIHAKNETRMTALMHAVSSGREDAVNFLIKAKADVNAQDDFARSALSIACSDPKLYHLIKPLVKANAESLELFRKAATQPTGVLSYLNDADAETSALTIVAFAHAGEHELLLKMSRMRGNMLGALHLAMTLDERNVSKAILKAIRESNSFNLEYDKAVQEIAKTGTSDLMIDLIKNGYVLDKRDEKFSTLLMIASKANNVEVMKVLIAANMDVSVLNSNPAKKTKSKNLSEENYRYDTALTLAARAGKSDAVKLLLESGANGDAAIMHLAQTTDVNALKILLDLGVRGENALFFACKNGRGTMITRLLKLNVDKFAKDAQGRTMLMHAVNSFSHTAVRALLPTNKRFLSPSPMKALIDAVDNKGDSALIYGLSAQKDHNNFLSELITAGANQFDALISATSKGGNEWISKLITAGLDINVKNSLGRTALMHFAESGDLAQIGSLLAAGADKDLTDNAQETAVQIARRAGKVDVLAILGAPAQLEEYPDAQSPNKRLRIN